MLLAGAKTERAPLREPKRRQEENWQVHQETGHPHEELADPERDSQIEHQHAIVEACPKEETGRD